LNEDEPDQAGDEQSLMKAVRSPCSLRFQHRCVRWNRAKKTRRRSWRPQRIAATLNTSVLPQLGLLEKLLVAMSGQIAGHWLICLKVLLARSTSQS
jgi:hypothetical protein